MSLLRIIPAVRGLGAGARLGMLAGGVFALILFAAGGGAVFVQAANCSTADEAIASQTTASLQGVPKKYVAAYIGASEKFKLGERGPAILAGIHKVETNFGTSDLPGVKSGVNSYGCCAGPMQFSTAPYASDTWGAYAVDGDGDGRKDIYDNVDAIYTAAHYLQASGAPGSWYDAIFAYNHADWYVKEVEDWAAKFGKGSTTVEVAQTTQPSAIDSDASVSGISKAYSDFSVLVARGTGLSLRVVGGWTLAEGGPDDNPLNIGPGKTYGSIEAGAKATIELLETSLYRGVLASAGMSDSEQLDAITASPWCPGCGGYRNLLQRTYDSVKASGDPGSTTTSEEDDGEGCKQPDAPAGATGPAQLDKAVRISEPQTFTNVPAKYMNAGRAPEPFDTRLMPDLLWVLETYELKVNAARESGHHTHGDGTAVDLAPGEDAGSIAHWDETAKRLAEDLGWTPGCAASGTAPVCPLKPAIQFVGYNGFDSAHGDPSHTGSPHIHVSWQSDCYGCGGGALVDPRNWVMAFPAPGIDLGGSK